MQNAPRRRLAQSARPVLILATLALSLTACASDRKITVWTKANVSDDQRAKDLSACKRYADQQMAGRRGAQTDVEVMTGGVNSGIKPSLNSNLGAYSDAKENDQLVSSCMTDLGYTGVR